MKTFLFVLLSASIYAQNLEHLKSQDTLYFVLKELNGNITVRDTFKKFKMESFGNDKITEYQIIDSLNRVIYISVPKDIIKPLSDKQIVVKRKKFIRKNKEQIITLEFIKQFNPEDLFIGYLDVSVKRKGKVIYVIDEESLKKKDNEIILRKAFIVPVSYAQF